MILTATANVFLAFFPCVLNSSTKFFFRKKHVCRSRLVLTDHSKLNRTGCLKPMEWEYQAIQVVYKCRRKSLNFREREVKNSYFHLFMRLMRWMYLWLWNDREFSEVIDILLNLRLASPSIFSTCFLLLFAFFVLHLLRINKKCVFSKLLKIKLFLFLLCSFLYI